MKEKMISFLMIILFQMTSYSMELKEIEYESDAPIKVKNVEPEKKAPEPKDTRFGYVYIAGEVKENKPIEWKEKMTITDALVTVGWIDTLRAKPTKIKVKRGKIIVYEVDINKILDVEDPDANFYLQRGDTIIVPRNIWAKISDILRKPLLPFIDFFGSISSVAFQGMSYYKK